MSHFEFMIPIQRDDLLQDGEAGSYTVRHVYDLPDLRSSVHDLVVALSTDRGEFVLDKFDVLYSAVVHFSSLKTADREQIWETVNKGYVYLTGDLSALLESEDCLDSETRMKYLNLLKMSTYVLCQLAEAFEDAAQRPTDIITTGKGRKKAGRVADEDVDWEAQRFRVLRQLYTALQLQLRRLWEPPVPDEEFVNVIGNVCYHFLALTSVGHVRNKALRESIFQVLGALVRSYGHSLSCSLKMIQMLQQYEHCPAPLAQGAVTIALEYQGRGLINDMVREIAGTDAEELAKDGSATRHYAEFLSLVAVQAPDLVLNNICLLVGHLDGESHLMRNSVLSILGDMVSLVLNGEQLEPKQRGLRDEFLDNLEQHMHDVHAFVRTKVLQIWRRLVSEGAVPLSRQRTVLRLAVGRLQDTSSNVRRAALQLVTAFLQANPFAAKLPVAELEEQYKAEKAKLAELGVEDEDDGGDEDKEDDEEEEEEEDVLTKALFKAKKQLVAILTASVAESAEPALLESGQQLLTLLSADGPLDAAAELLLAQPGLVPGLLPAADQSSSQSSKEAPAGQTSQSREEAPQEVSQEQEQQPAAAMTRAQLAGALDMLVQTAAADGDPDRQMQIDKQKMMVLYFKDSVVFARLIDEAIPGICAFLRSAQTSDILEAVSFFVTAFEFGLLKAMVGIRQMLNLIWSKEKGIKDAVVDAYKRLYIPTEGNERFRAHQVVTNLSALCEDASLSELTSLEELVVQLVGSGQVGPACIQLLWERFTGAAAEAGQGGRRAALILIGMVAGAEASVVSSNLDVLVEHGLRGGADEKPADFRLVQSVCTALLKMAPGKPRADDPLPPVRLSPEHQLFVLLSDILVGGLPRTDDVYYTPMAQAAVDVIYQLADRPDSLMESLLRRLNAAVVGAGGAQLARWLAVVGHTAVCQLTYLDVHVFTELKRRNRLREEAAGQRTSRRRGSQDTPGSASGTPAHRRRLSQDGDEEDGLMGAAANDAEAEFISSLCEHHVVNGDGMLAAYLPLLVEINSEPERFKHRNLRAAAALALSKFMLVSSVVCEEHLQLLFTVLERSSDDVIRSNIIIALGDMSFRFPNLIEPWTPNIYARLRDDSVRVRKTTLTVLTHLILNDMVKVKGQISEVAERLVDSEDGLRAMAKEFFSELAHKGNALYNVMPDIVSRLSDPDVGLPEDDFHTVLHFVLGLIQKDRQLESLVEKLCHRLRAAPEPRQWRDLAFCLSLINFSDRCVRKLLENFSCFAEKLHEKDVYDCFSKITNDAKRAAKSGEARSTCEEFESRLTEAHQKAVEDDNAASGANRAAAKKQAATARATRGGKAGEPDLTPRRSALSAHRQRATRQAASPSSSSGDDSGEDAGEEEEEKVSAGEKAAAGSEDDAEEEEEENVSAGEKTAAGSEDDAEEEKEEEKKPQPAARQSRTSRPAPQQPGSRSTRQQRSTRPRR